MNLCSECIGLINDPMCFHELNNSIHASLIHVHVKVRFHSFIEQLEQPQPTDSVALE